MYTDTGELVLEDSPHTLRPDAGHTDGAVVVVDVETGKLAPSPARNKNTKNLVNNAACVVRRTHAASTRALGGVYM